MLRTVTIALLTAALGAAAAGAPAPRTLEAGPATLTCPSPPWQDSSLSFQVSGVPIVSSVGAFVSSADWKQRLFDFRNSETVSSDSFAGRSLLLRRRGDFGQAEQEATLGPNFLELRWLLDLQRLAGNLEISVLVPEAALGVSPYEAVFQDGTTAQDQLWVEQRAALVNLRQLTVRTPRGRIAVDLGQQGGWQFQDLRRSEGNRGMYRFVLPVYGLTSPFRREVRLRVTVEPPAVQFSALPLGAAANMALADEREGDGKGGWTDQGDNDLRTLPTGLQYFHGIPFEVAQGGKPGAVMLRGGDRGYLATEAKVAVGRPAAELFFLHGCAWAGAGKTAFTARLHYADGTTAEQAVRVGQETTDWWGVRDLGPNARVAWRGANNRAPVGLMLLRWPNPHPEKAIRELSLQAGDGPVAGIVAVTAASGPVPLGTADGGTGRLPSLRVASAGLTGLDNCFRGTKLDPDFKAFDLKQAPDLSVADLLVATEDLPAEAAARVAARVRAGGRLLVFGPPPRGLAELLPVRMAEPPVLRAVAPYWRWAAGEPRAFFLQAEAASPLVSGLDLAQMAPAGALYEVTAAPGATVEAAWKSTDGQQFAAVVRQAVGQGTVTYFNFPRLYPASGGTDYARLFTSLNRYWDPFLLKLAYHAAGQDDTARRIGEVFAAKALRERLLPSWAGLRLRLEELRGLADAAGTAAAQAQFERAAAGVAAADRALDAGDGLIGGLAGREASAAYEEAGAALHQATAEAQRCAEGLRRGLLAEGKARTVAMAAGPPLQVGATHVNGGLVYPAGPSRQWFYRQALRRMHEQLGWSVFDIVVGGYGAGQLRPDGKEVTPQALDDIASAATEAGMKMILCTVGGAFTARPEEAGYTAGALTRRTETLTRLARYFNSVPACYAFEPNNEPGLGVKPETMAGYEADTLGEFRAWLLGRHGGLAKLNVALGTAFADAAGITPPRAEELGQVPVNDPRRALWAQWIEFRFALMERLHRRDFETIRAVSRKPIFDRTAGDGMNWCGVPGSGALQAARQDRRSKWHDALGSHVISPFLLDYQVGMSRGKRIVQSEYYWSTYGGGSDGVRYRFGGNFMHPVLENESRNFAAVERNFWKAVSRGNDLFTIYYASPVNAYGQFDEGYWGPHVAYWGDHSFKGMTYAAKVVPEAINRLRGELLGARHVPQVGLLEPLASIVHTLGTPVGADIRDPQYEAEGLHKLLLREHVQTELVGEWRLLEGPPPAAPAGQPVSAMPRELPPVLVVPYGVFLGTATQEKLLQWVRQGGTLLATGPAGLYDEAGRSSAKLLQGVFPALQVSRGDGTSVSLSEGTVRRRWTFGGAAPERSYGEGGGAVLRGTLGKGEVIVTGFPYLDGPEAVAALLRQAVSRHAPAQVDTDNPAVQLYLCRRGEAEVLYVVNEDHAATQSARVRLARPREVADLRLGLALGTRSELAVNLLPGEGRVYRLAGR